MSIHQIKFEPVLKIEVGEIGIGQFDAWNILTALHSAERSRLQPGGYWEPRMKGTYFHLSEFFRQTFDYGALPHEKRYNR